MTPWKLTYWIATGLMCLIFAFSAINYVFQYDLIADAYKNLGFPTWLIYPSAIAKLLGIVAVLSRKSDLLKEWAYAGFFFDVSLALTAHLTVSDGQWHFAAVALVATVVSRYAETQVFVADPDL